MRTRAFLMISIMTVLLLASGSAWAQRPSSTTGYFDLGLLTPAVDGEAARYQRFRDLRGGPFGGFHIERTTDSWLIELDGTSVGRRDQRYVLDLERPGKVELSFMFDSIPLNYSETTRSFYTEGAPGVLTFPSGVKAALAGGSQAAVGDAAPLFDMRVTRKVAGFEASWWATPDIDVRAEAKTTQRTGNQPWMAGFGFSPVIEMPAPIDQRTNDMDVSAEWGNAQGFLRVGYQASWFENNVQTLVFDSPISSGAAQGRMSTAPSNTSQTVSAVGSMKVLGDSRLTGVVALGSHEQNEALLPFHNNAAFPVLPLDRGTARAEANTTAVNLNFTSRPADRMRFDARYRYYNYDNKTPVFHVTDTVRSDNGLQLGTTQESEALSVKRQNFDVDLSYSLARMTSLKVGYGHQKADRTFRIFETTGEDTFRVIFDALGNERFTLRAKYEISQRTGEGFQEHILEEVAEQPGMRHFDVADRDRQRFTGILMVMPTDTVDVTFSVGAGRDDYTSDGIFGLRDNDHAVYTVAVNSYPSDDLALGASYTHEKYTATQRSRNSSPGATFLDPARDWTTDTDDRVQTLSGYLDLQGIWENTDIRFGYDYVDSNLVYTFDQPFFGPATLQPIENTLHRGTVDARFNLDEQFSVGLMYWLDKYSVVDQALDGSTGLFPTSSAFLMGYFWEPYTNHTYFLSVFYNF